MSKLKKLRDVMKKYNINYYIIPSADPHQSEYVAEYYRGRAEVSGFTGSAGTLLVGEKEAKLWTDGRYFIQAAEQLQGTGIDLMKMATPGYDTINQWIEKNIKENETLGFDGSCYSTNQYKELLKIAKKNNFNINMDKDLLEEIWNDRPSLPEDKIFVHDEKYCGKSVKEKLNEVRKYMKKNEVQNYLLTSLDDIAWLFNIRGNDILFNPVALSYAIITENEAKFYIKKTKVNDEVQSALKEQEVDIYEYNEIEEHVKQLNGNTLIDPAKVNAKLYSLLSCTIIEKLNITTNLKAIKNEIEIANFENAHIKDGVAMVKFIKYLKDNIGKEKITEISASKKLSELRSQGELAKGDSFGTIAGYKEHAAMMHYSATPESDYELKPQGLFLVDSGGQYLDGTTDITRTFVLGKITEEEKRDFTLVLKGHINLAKAKFLKGSTGCNLDVLARGPLWQYGLDYKCGTGHGIGFFLNVHEGPQGIRPNGNTVPLELGMMLTNEPGVYKEGKFGIRTENVMVVVKDEINDCGEFYKFDTISYCPIDLNGVKVELLNDDEKEWLNNYHKKVYDKLSPYLNKEEKELLKIETREI
ncbi:aminopeptidase P family protein [uncultured Clostridium sp.]|uniref:aminopeptidase P family protein n=1 Tax=uncultured Clostridium sp. TaxID=59620 RepID=UPI00260115D8|nr:aminopeptidase P family protein [uncultured Clostridium sp.]MDU4883031.1 aminopeptidase P family protein [Clostridium celatum]MDU7076249.1 aminopeptidase P family protein [Clostridium celatum]